MSLAEHLGNEYTREQASLFLLGLAMDTLDLFQAGDVVNDIIAMHKEMEQKFGDTEKNLQALLSGGNDTIFENPDGEMHCMLQEAISNECSDAELYVQITDAINESLEASFAALYAEKE